MLLLRAFAIVVLLTTGLLLGLTGLFISRICGSIFDVRHAPAGGAGSLLSRVKEAGKGWKAYSRITRWKGRSEALWQLQHTVLMDADNRIILSYGKVIPASENQVYSLPDG